MKILIVEDDQTTCELLSATLTAHRYAFDLANDGRTGLELTTFCEYDLILLDLKIPQIDGLSVCRQLRAREYTKPILILTAKNSEEDIIKGLDAGADDYVTKPFSPKHLLARIRALLRRQPILSATPTLTWGDLCLNPTMAEVTYQDKVISLTPLEYNLLEMFLRYPQRIFSRSTIIDRLWSIEEGPTEHAVTNLVKDLRQKLKSAGLTEPLIDTVYKLGYRLRERPKVKSEPSLTVNPEQLTTSPLTSETLATTTNIPPPPSPGEKTLAALKQISERFYASIGQRLAILQAVQTAIELDNLTDEIHQAAQSEAHKLAGNLGMLGYSRGSELARAIELLLTEDLHPPKLDKSSTVKFLNLYTSLQKELAKPPILPNEAHIIPIETLVLLIDSDPLFGQTMAQEARQWGIKLVRVNNSLETMSYLKQYKPAAILLNLEPTDLPQSFSLLQTLKIEFISIPIIILAEKDNWHDRVQVARLGGDRYIPKSTKTIHIWETLVELIPSTKRSDVKVMIVDDDPIALHNLSSILQRYGMEVIALSDPNRFWESLTNNQPDLLLLDLEMPNFKGTELCQIVRQDSNYGDLPILVVTAHTDPMSLRKVFAVGADDCISKPINGTDLIMRVTSRVARSRSRQQAQTIKRQHSQQWLNQSKLDSLTQIASRQYFNEYLELQWEYSLQQHTPICLIFCEVDYFSLYNSYYGHDLTNLCLQQIASKIKECITLDNILIGRYSHNKFALILGSMTTNESMKIAAQIQQQINQLEIPHERSPISSFVTLSMGITGTIPQMNQTIENLIDNAERALNTAKELGHNTNCLYS